MQQDCNKDSFCRGTMSSMHEEYTCTLDGWMHLGQVLRYG